MPIEEQIARLLFRKLEGLLTPDEEKELEEWAEGSESYKLLLLEIEEDESLAYDLQHTHPDNWLAASQRMKQKVMKDSSLNEETNNLHRIHFLKTAWFRIAASILLFIGIGAYLWLTMFNNAPQIATSKPVPAENDVLPGGNKAILILADGSQIVLDSAGNGLLAQQSGATIQKTSEGQLAYIYNEDLLSSSVSYNTMSTPRGGQYQLALPDGSKVWLNAESSITFPTAFVGPNRVVKIIGEAYFEIKSNKEKPFVVNTEKDTVIVLGTSFNVKAYRDDPVQKISLLQGAVRVNQQLLKPGQALQDGIVVSTNLEQDIAWKNGVFDFNHLTIPEVMRQLARWYDLDIHYTGKSLPDVRLYGSMDKNLSLRQVLEGLRDMNIHYQIEGRKLTIQP